MRKDIVAEVVGSVRAAAQPMPLEALADRAVRALGHDKTVGSAWGGAGSFRDLLSRGLPGDVRLSDQPPYFVFDASRQITADTEPRPELRQEPRQETRERRPEIPRYALRAPPVSRVPSRCGRRAPRRLAMIACPYRVLLRLAPPRGPTRTPGRRIAAACRAAAFGRHARWRLWNRRRAPWRLRSMSPCTSPPTTWRPSRSPAQPQGPAAIGARGRERNAAAAVDRAHPRGLPGAAAVAARVSRAVRGDGRGDQHQQSLRRRRRS